MTDKQQRRAKSAKDAVDACAAWNPSYHPMDKVHAENIADESGTWPLGWRLWSDSLDGILGYPPGVSSPPAWDNKIRDLAAGRPTRSSKGPR